MYVWSKENIFGQRTTACQESMMILFSVRVFCSTLEKPTFHKEHKEHVRNMWGTSVCLTPLFLCRIWDDLRRRILTCSSNAWSSGLHLWLAYGSSMTTATREFNWSAGCQSWSLPSPPAWWNPRSSDSTRPSPKTHVDTSLKHTKTQHQHTCSETSYRITDVECIARAQTIP